MPTYLDIESWNRKEQFYFFREYDYPFFNICADVDVTELLKYCKQQDISFFQATLFLSLKTANEIEPFRYRIRGGKVLLHDIIHGGTTVLNQDETFSFSYFSYYAGFREFAKRATESLEKKSFDPQDERDDLIHYSIIPWISFTSFSHARKFRKGDSIPKIVFGKYHRRDAATKMPVSVEVHHALMDGIHVGKFFELFQEYLNNPQKVLIN